MLEGIYLELVRRSQVESCPEDIERLRRGKWLKVAVTGPSSVGRTPRGQDRLGKAPLRAATPAHSFGVSPVSNQDCALFPLGVKTRAQVAQAYQLYVNMIC